MQQALAFSPHADQRERLRSRLAALEPGENLTVIGVELADWANMFAGASATVLRLDLGSTNNPVVIARRVLGDLADLALHAWPNWPGAHLRTWRKMAERLAGAGRLPLFRRMATETQFRELYAAAGSPVLLFAVDSARPERAAPLISSLEWCCRHGASTVAMLSKQPSQQPPWDRILYGALTFENAPPPSAVARLISSSAGVRPPGSAMERRLRAALAADPELTGLFKNEVTINLGALGPAPRVDLLWPAGKIVVELDGAEHERDPNYGADRHRDYELLVAGYLVLRLTNAEVDLDLGRSLDKVRRVVKLRKTE